jgi:beta-N-acetylhexosaminidase
MTELEKQIGQMLLVGVRGTELSADERTAFHKYKFGGFVLFETNCENPAQIHQLCRSLWKVSSDLPPFIAIDAEGGSVHRLPEPLTHFPAAQLIGQTARPELAYRVGLATAVELKLLEINLNFAPVLDVNSIANNPVIGERSFGSDPLQVSTMALACARGLGDGGIIACGKHFPGHGATEQDSHSDLPTVDRLIEQLRAIDLPPFFKASHANVEALMTAHVRFTALDSALPATLSPRIITGLLRNEMAFKGLVFSDDMEMGSISDHYGEEEGALRCVHAGVDVLMYCHDLEKAVRVLDFLCREASHDNRLKARIGDSYGRITALKGRKLRPAEKSSDAELLDELSRFNHRKLVEEIHGSL